MSSLGSARNAAQSQECTCPVSVVMRSSQESVFTRGGGPADSTGKSVTRYWPGGSFSPGCLRPWKPGDTIPITPQPPTFGGTNEDPPPGGRTPEAMLVQRV